MTHRAEQIVDAVVAAIQAQPNLPVSSANVYAHRTLTLDDSEGEMNAITVNVGDDQPSSELGTDNLAFIDSLLSLSIVGYASDDTEPLVKAALFDQRRRIHQALLANDTLNLAFVIAVRYGGASTPELDATTQHVVGRLESHWQVHYRMNFSDPGT